MHSAPCTKHSVSRYLSANIRHFNSLNTIMYNLSYDIYILDSDGLIKKHMNITSRYYLSDMPAAFTEHIGGLKAGTEYKIKIVANSFWRTRSDALTARFATL